MIEAALKATENRLRRAARRRGQCLERSRRRDTTAPDYGTYQIRDVRTNRVVGGGGAMGYGMTLDDVLAWFEGAEQAKATS
jgi:hypothetical protein